MKIMTYFNAKEKAESRVYLLETNLGALGNKTVWAKLMRVLRQKNKFTERLIQLIEKADNQ